jgi:hypothetical protein
MSYSACQMGNCILLVSVVRTDASRSGQTGHAHGTCRAAVSGGVVFLCQQLLPPRGSLHLRPKVLRDAPDARNHKPVCLPVRLSVWPQVLRDAPDARNHKPVCLPVRLSVWPQVLRDAPDAWKHKSVYLPACPTSARPCQTGVHLSACLPMDQAAARPPGHFEPRPRRSPSVCACSQVSAKHSVQVADSSLQTHAPGSLEHKPVCLSACLSVHPPGLHTWRPPAPPGTATWPPRSRPAQQPLRATADARQAGAPPRLRAAPAPAQQHAV